MNFTYFIGNGFDLACGFKTKYADFINEYITKRSDDDKESLRIFKMKIERDFSTWTDAEIAFGNMTKTITDPREFRTYLDDFVDKLSIYLDSEQKKLKTDTLSHAQLLSFYNGLTHFDTFLSEDSREAVFRNFTPDQISIANVNSIVFNYTDIYEKILSSALKQKSSLSISELVNNYSINFNILPPNYAHGSIANRPLIFGVNDEFQIYCDTYKTSAKARRAILKPESNSLLRKTSLDRCRSLVNDSDIICIFGMSLGQTDTFWWREIFNWMVENVYANLIIYNWNTSCILSSAGSCIDTIEDCKDNFIKYSAITSKPIVASIASRIHVVINKNPFNLSRIIKE